MAGRFPGPFNMDGSKSCNDGDVVAALAVLTERVNTLVTDTEEMDKSVKERLTKLERSMHKVTAYATCASVIAKKQHRPTTLKSPNGRFGLSGVGLLAAGGLGLYALGATAWHGGTCAVIRSAEVCEESYEKWSLDMALVGGAFVFLFIKSRRDEQPTVKVDTTKTNK